MAFVHPQSCECMKSELDIFTVPPTQTSIETGNWVEYNPIASIADRSPIEFTVSGSGQDYLDAANTQLYVKAKITQADGTDIAGDAAVGPVNLFLHSLLMGPFNYYVTLFLANSDPPCHKVSHRPDPPPCNVTLVCRPENRKSVNKTYTIIVCFINRFSIFGPTDERYVTGGGGGGVGRV